MPASSIDHLEFRDSAVLFTSSNKKNTGLANALILYLLYRSSLYHTRINAEILDIDMALEGLDNYVARIALSAAKDMYCDPKVKTYAAYRNVPNCLFKKMTGFVCYYETEFAGKQVIYIDHIGVYTRGQGVGIALLKKILNLFPAEQEFVLCVRKSNTVAINIYTRLGFEINQEPVRDFGYNEEFFYGMVRSSNYGLVENITPAITM